MEYLKDFKWSQKVPDDKQFISNESVINESVSLRILRNEFHNPLLESSSEDDAPSKNIPKSICNKKIPNNNFMKKNPENTFKKKITNYTPGLCNLPIFPQKSSLSPDQHKICIKVIQSQNNYCITMPQVSINDNEHQVFNNMIPVINEERKIYMEYVKNIWLTKTCGRHLKILDEHEQLIEHIQNKHKNAFKKYPRYYQMASMLPLVYNHNVPVEIAHVKDLHEINKLPLVKIPSLKNRFVLPKNFDDLLTDKTGNGFKFENRVGVVSEDNLCEELALKHKAHIVISSNGLKTLADCQPPFSQFWDLPIFIKEYKIEEPQNKFVSHSVVYIDRSIPICKLTNKEKSLKCFKHLLKSTLTRSENFDDQDPNSKKRDAELEPKNVSEIKTIENSQHSQDDDESLDDLIIDEIPNMDTTKDKNESQNDKLNLNSNDQNKFDTKPEILANTKKNDPFITYKLWNIGQVKEKKLLSKNLEEDIKVIVRCKIDGHEMNSQGEKLPLNIVPKIEYQNEFGSEMNTPSETAHHWSLLQFRPHSKLIKARIIANKGEIMMIEKLPLISITNEAAKHNLWKPEAALGCYFNIFSRLSKLQPGQYILRHDPKSHAFAILYNSVQSKCENGLDLHENYEYADKFLINQTAPWTPIDPYLVTPNLAHHNVMPCMFTPGSCKVLKNTKPKVIEVPKSKKFKKKMKAKKKNDK